MSKLVYGVGLYEKGQFKAKVSGKHTKSYQTWQGMLERCYDPKLHAKYPTYIDCSVCPEWLDFQVFARWFEDNHPNDGKKYQIDKDLKILNNKIYSPITCLFAPKLVNTFTLDCGAVRGEYLIGVTWHKQAGKFIARCNNPFTGEREYLGLFSDELQAHKAWRQRKSELAYELAMAQENPEVKEALLRWKLALDNNDIHKI